VDPLLVPRRRRGREVLDDLTVDARIVTRSLADVARANTLFGGARAVLAELDAVLRTHGPRPLTVLDVGTGIGDIPARARAWARARGVHLTTVGLDGSEALARAACSAEHPVVRADALAIPVRDRSVDVVLCSQLLHHFDDDTGVRLLRELDRVARLRVIVSDLRRSWLAAAGIWVASFPLGFHPVSRHDGVVSVLRGFTRHELERLVRAATGCTAETRHRIGFRATAAWTPAAAVA